jgi:hypothetical protein
MEDPQPDASDLNLGTQPLDAIMLAADLTNHDLVAASPDHITHKMVARARKGRRLKRKVQLKILDALNAHAKAKGDGEAKAYTLADLFNYKGLF